MTAVPEGSIEGARPAPSQDGFVIAPHLFQTFLGADDDPVVVWNRSRDEVLKALDQPGALQIETRGPWGHPTVDEFLGFAFYDPLVHAWDLAKAVGQQPILDASLAQQALDQLNAFDKHKDLRQPISLAAPIVTTAQDAVTRLIAFCGRQP